jgi:hypothetical protein
MRSDARKKLTGDHWTHPDAGVRELILEACVDAWDEGYARGLADIPWRPATSHNPYRDRP